MRIEALAKRTEEQRADIAILEMAILRWFRARTTLTKCEEERKAPNRHEYSTALLEFREAESALAKLGVAIEVTRREQGLT